MHQNSAMYEQQQLNKTEGTSNGYVIQPTAPFEVATTHESAYTLGKCRPEKVWPWNWNCDNSRIHDQSGQHCTPTGMDQAATIHTITTRYKPLQFYTQNI